MARMVNIVLMRRDDGIVIVGRGGGEWWRIEDGSCDVT